MTDQLHQNIDPIYRTAPNGLALRADDNAEAGTTLVGHFCRFNEWNEIDSYFEGRFLERVEPGAFRRVINSGWERVQATFDHGYDAQLGDKPLGPIDVLREDAEGPYYEVPLLDTDYNRNFILPALQGRLLDGRTVGSTLGASYRFRVVAEEWNDDPGVTDENPEGLPERRIKEVRLYEFGPVVYPADPGATAGVRSLTDHFVERARQRTGTAPTDRTGPAPGTPVVETVDPLTQHSASPNPMSAAQIRAHMALATRKESV